MGKQRKWDRKKIILESKKYKTMSDFIKKAGGAYGAAKRLGLVEECRKHMKSDKKPHNYWTKERVFKEAKKYNTRNNFRVSSNGAYCKAVENGWLDDCCRHMKKGKTPNGFWNDKEKVLKEAKKYKTKDEFQRKSSGAYKSDKKLGIWKEATANMKVFARDPWTKEEVLVEAKKYKTKNEFQKKSASAYNAAKKFGVYEQATKHMRAVGNRYKRALYAFEFSDKSVYVGLTYDYEKRYKEHLSKTKKIIDKLNHFEAHYVTYNEFFSQDQASIEERNLIEKYRKKGWKILNEKDGGALGGGIEKWTKSEIAKEAKKHKTITSFYKNSKGAYGAACRLNILDKVTTHMEYSKTPNGYWDKNLIKKEVKKYKNLDDFRTKSPGAYGAANRLGFLEEICKPLKRERLGNNYWTESKIREEVKKYKTIRDFSKNAASAYGAASRLGILEEIKKDLKYLRKQWTEQEILKEAKKYKTKKKFFEKAAAVYQAAKTRGIHDKATAHMKSEVRKPWTREDLHKEARKYKHKKDFREKAGGAYTASNRLDLMKELESYWTKTPSSNLKWTKEAIFKEAKKYRNRREMEDKVGGACHAARKLGLSKELSEFIKKNNKKKKKKSNQD